MALYLLHGNLIVCAFFLYSMYCVDVLFKVLFFGFLLYYIGGALFGSFFESSSVTIADSIVDSLDVNNISS